MYTKIYRYHIPEKNYPKWLALSRTSDAMFEDYPEVSYKQMPTRRIGGGMDIEEVLIYPSKEASEQIIHALMQQSKLPILSNTFLDLVDGEIGESEIE